MSVTARDADGPPVTLAGGPHPTNRRGRNTCRPSTFFTTTSIRITWKRSVGAAGPTARRAEIVVDADQGALHLGDHRLGDVHMCAGLRLGVFLVAVGHHAPPPAQQRKAAPLPHRRTRNEILTAQPRRRGRRCARDGIRRAAPQRRGRAGRPLGLSHRHDRGYVVDGHLPFETVKKLLEDRTSTASQCRLVMASRWLSDRVPSTYATQMPFSPAAN